MVMAIIGIVIALALFIFMVYRGWRNYYIAPICVVIVCVTNQLNPVQAFTDSFIPGVLEMFATCFVIIFLGTIFGRVYADTGASISLANFFTKHFIDPFEGNRKVFGAIIAFFILSSLCIIGGIDCYALFFSLFPLVVIMCQRANIPRRFIPGMLYLNAAFFCCPGVPQIYNIITKSAFATVGYDWSVTSALIPGIVAVAVIGIGGIFTLYYMIKKAKSKGEEFDYGGVERYQIEEGKKLPNPIIALLPLACVFILYTIVGWDILVALTAGILLDLILMGRFIDKTPYEGKFRYAIKSIFNRGVDQFPAALVTLSIPNGLATVITSTVAFGTLTAFLSGLQMNPLILVILIICVIVAITSAPPTALMVGIPLIIGILQTRGIDINIAGIGRVAALAAATFETLPINGAIMTTLSLSQVSHKEGYRAEFMESVVFCLIGTVVCALLVGFFPALS